MQRLPGKDARARSLSTPSVKVSANIAVVDDDPSVRRALDRLLRSEGFMVVAFPSAEQFLALCRPQAVACLILDLQLGGMSGAELQAHMAASGTTVPTVIITAHDDLAAREAARRSGSRAFLMKPFDDQELIDVVREVVGG
jgi:FixJ family two-component response regulator